MTTLLQELQKISKIDCDTLESDFAKRYGPFVDCTSNHAIAYGELSKPKHSELIVQAAELSATLASKLRNGDLITREALAVEYCTAKLLVDILPSVSGVVMFQLNPAEAYNSEQMVRSAHRVLDIFKYIQGGQYDANRVCFKISTNWEGMQAAAILRSENIHVLATTLFCIEQSVLAARSDCDYIAPYVNELRVHFDSTFKDDNQAFQLCADSEAAFRDMESRTKVLAASFTSMAEVLRLAGLEHITIPPPIIEELAKTPASHAQVASLSSPFRKLEKSIPHDNGIHVSDVESDWKYQFTRAQFGECERKISQALNYFGDFQEKMEAMIKKQF